MDCWQGIGDTIDGACDAVVLTLFIGITNTGNIMGVGYIIVEALFMWTIYWQSYKLDMKGQRCHIVTIMKAA